MKLCYLNRFTYRYLQIFDAVLSKVSYPSFLVIVG